MINQYPFDSLPRRLVLAGKRQGNQLRGALVKLQRVATRKRETFRSDCAGSPSESRCSEELLENILAARDEQEAAKLKAVPR